jgi:pimeloyl-ACP methyl ester carboxylesterase
MRASDALSSTARTAFSPLRARASSKPPLARLAPLGLGQSLDAAKASRSDAFLTLTRASADVIDVSDASSDDTRVRASASANPIVVLSGFGNCSSDYEDALGNDEASLAKSLRSRGFSVHVAEVERKDWFVGILRGIFTKGFWMNACTTRESYGWYLERVDECVKEALRANPEATSVDIVAHSAGGWLARAFIGGALAMNASEVECSGDFLKRDERVRRLICLGTPHAQDAKSDPTRGASKWVNDTWPGAYFEPDVQYVCVTGRAVVGNASAEPKTIGKYAAGSYAVVAGGDGDGVEGDAVVPNCAALALEGAEMIVIDACWHSMSTVGTFDEPSKFHWYGSDAVVDRWLKVLRA